MWKYLTIINWYKIGKFQTFEIFQYCAHAQIRNTVKSAKNAEKHKQIFKTNSYKRHEILQKIYIRHHMTSHEYYQCNTKRKVELH